MRSAMGTLKSLFWNADRAPDRVVVATPPPAPPRAREPEATMTRSGGEPKLEQLLVAFEAMQPVMQPRELGVALHATAKAIGAPVASIVEALDQRLGALVAVVADEQRKITERQTARTAELAATTSAAHTEIEAMKHKIATLEHQLAAATVAIQQHTAREHEALAELDRKARGEATRLGALRQLLALK